MAKFEDLREWVDQANQIGELVVVEEADTKYEIGTIAQLTAKNQGPVVLYQNIKGYPSDFRVITNMLSNIRTVNLTFGLPLDNTIRDSVESLRAKAREWETSAQNFPPRVVETAPILENVLEGDDIDLSIFPTPVWHELDGGPYIGTADAVITRDPETGQINVGTYRSQLFDRQNLGLHISPGHHGRIHLDRYFKRGEACPIVAVFGADPLLFAISASEIPQDVCELDYIGAIKREPVPVIKGAATGLPIPATAEIAIEGFADPIARKLEGPFGEWPGYYAGQATEQPSIRAVTLYHRGNAILCGSPPAKGSYSTHSLCNSIWRSALLYNEIVRANIPGVKGVWYPQFSGRYMQIVSIEQLYDGHATQVGHVVAGTSTAARYGRYTIIVDDDINPYDLEDVLWAVCTRSDPVEADIIKRARSGHLDPIIRRPAEAFTTSRQIIYALKPYEWRHEFPAVNLASQKSRKQCFDKWKGLFTDRWRNI